MLGNCTLAELPNLSFYCSLGAAARSRHAKMRDGFLPPHLRVFPRRIMRKEILTTTLNTRNKRSLKYFLLMAAIAILLGLPARAETVTGTFRYLDSDGTLRPISSARVEIWRFAPRFLGIWSWGNDATVATNGSGSISVPMSFVKSGVIYGVRVFATNNAAVVYPNAAINTGPFYQEPGQPSGSVIH